MKMLSFAIIGLFVLNTNFLKITKISPGIAKNSFIHAEIPLQGTHWNLVALSNANTALEKTRGNIFIILNKDSTVTGNGGCNSFTGKYILGKNHELSFGEMVRTNVACPAIDVERKFINALAKTDHYYVKEDTLSLTAGQFRILVKFVATR